MKNIMFFPFIVIILFSFSRCKERDSRLDSFHVPIWNKNDLDWHTSNILIYKIYSEKNPPFHKETSFSYEMGETLGDVLFFYQFSDFQNQFVDPINIIKGARTVSLKSGKLLAEAKIDYFVDVNQQSRQLEEYHYGENGMLIYYCKSLIDSESGFKIKEKKKIGRKKRDYYFIWPVR